LVILVYPIFVFLGTAIDKLEEVIHIPIPVGIIFLFLCVIAYFVYVYLYISRIQERQADKYAIDFGTDVNVFISALKKIATLNDSLMKTKKIDEKFQTHPSFEKRINWLQKYQLGEAKK
jgi:STE24 endopeptidase